MKLTACIAAVAVSLIGKPSVAEIDPYRQPAVRELMAAVTFYVSFDAGLQPDLAAGDAWEPRVFGDYAGKHKRPEFATGLIGQALVLGSGNAIYPAGGNATLGIRGAMAFWTKAEAWKKDRDGNCVFFLAGRHFIVERQGPLPGPGGQRGRQASILCIGSGEGQKRATSIMAPDLKNRAWYFFVVNWSWPRFELSINGRAPRAKATAGNPPANSFSSFSLGSRSGSRALLDEFLIFSRPLTPVEIRNLFAAYRPVRE